MIILEIIYALICFLMVIINAELIKKGKRIYHGLNGAVHIICWVVIFWLVKSWQVIELPFIGRLFFDVLLDVWRNLPLGYVSDHPKSIIDKIEKWIWKDNGITPKLFYLAVIVGINVNLII